MQDRWLSPGRTTISRPFSMRGIRVKLAATAVAKVLLCDYNPDGHLPYTVYASLDGVSRKMYMTYRRVSPISISGAYPLCLWSRTELHAVQVQQSKTLQGREQYNWRGQCFVRSREFGFASGMGGVANVCSSSEVERGIADQKPARISACRLEPGETKHIKLALPASQLSCYDFATHKFVVAPGMFNVMIGS